MLAAGSGSSFQVRAQRVLIRIGLYVKECRQRLKHGVTSRDAQPSKLSGLPAVDWDELAAQRVDHQEDRIMQVKPPDLMDLGGEVLAFRLLAAPEKTRRD